MAIETHEPRALSAALSAPTPFTTRGGGSMLHAANRHVERWAPETTAANVRSMRSLGFVDRLVAPWIETAQRSASMRLFSQYSTAGAAQREAAAVSWVFPRPWYQDELDWMAAARQVTATAVEGESAPTMFTTRGTFVAPAPQQRPAIAAPQTAMPSALYEYVAPSLSIAQPTPQSSIAGIGYAGADSGRPLDAYSPLIPLAAVQAAELMSRAVAPLMRAPASPDGSIATPSTIGRVSPALRAVLTTMLERATAQRTDARVAQQAPELVTPPAPRPESSAQPAPLVSPAAVEMSSPASRLADHYAGQRAQIADLQRIARVSAERELSLRADAQANEASTARSATARSDAQTTAQRAEQAKAEVQRTAAVTDAQRAATVAATTEVQRAAAAERARIEERIAQRIAERTGADQARTGQQRLHEQARTEAAQHARMAELATSTPAATTPAVDPRHAPAPAEVLAAIAALPPELQQILAQRPERGMAAIAELGDVLRAAELMARSTHQNQSFEVTRGPRLMMPAGLGGLVSAVDRAHVIADRPAQLSSRFSSTMAAPAPIGTKAAPRSAQIVQRMPSLPWLTGPAAMPVVPTTALGATAAAQPAALAHVAWSDRWLARFAGAAPRSLEILHAAAGGSHEQRMAALASAAPESVFVRPMFDAMPRPAMPIEAVPTFGAAPASASLTPTPVLRPAPQPIERFDDNAETPDDVFAQIAAAAAGVRSAAATQASAPAARPAARPAALVAPAMFDARMTQADAVVHAAPGAPNAGLSAGLASSPFAAALRHLLPLPAAASFDVRALFGGGVSASYLAGLFTADAHAIGVEPAGIGAPAWASFAPAGTQAAESVVNERTAPELDLSYVSPERTAARDDVGTSAEDAAAQVEARVTDQAAVAASYAAPLTTLRTALLSWNVDVASPSPSLAQAPTMTAGPAVPATSSAARIMSESMSMPMLGDALPALDGGAAWTAPGMVGERAHSWSVAQERSSSDLSLDFVAPELVLAARIYGLGPAEAAQAVRLAIAGPGQLSAMASTVDRTFVQALSIASDRRAGGQLGGSVASASATGAAPAGPGAIATAYPIAPPASAGTVESDRAAGVSSAQPDHVLPTSAFGVERRTPRGAFLWPSASVAALGVSAAAHDGEQSMSVAALELLAAQAVAEIGTYAAFADRDAGALAGDDRGTDGPARESRTLPMIGSAAASPVGGATAMPSLAEPAEADVLGAAAALVSTSRRARFDALYVALSQSPSGRNWSPAARAARALALAGRGDETPVSAYERAATAWDVLPVVYATDGMSIAEIDAATATGALPRIARSAAAARGGRAGRPEMPAVATSGARPGVTRAGEALGSYVAPSTGELAAAATRSDSSAPRATSRELPVAQRAPSAAQELVQTGRPSGRHGGGEVEIPAWFESAARKMFDDRSSAGSGDMGISMSELTLVSAAPATQIAASTKAPHTASVAPAAASGNDKPAAGGAIDIDKIANDVYREIMAMMDTARSRNGEPYL